MSDMNIQKNFEVQVVKVDEALGVVFGYGFVCKERQADGTLGQYTDAHGDDIQEDANMLKACKDFMKGTRIAKVQHQGDAQGTIVFGFPLTEEIAEALQIEKANKTGFIIGMEPSPEMLAKFKSGELTGFSIGGTGYREKE